jgi:hypothetical protein
VHSQRRPNFLYFGSCSEKNHVWTLENFNVIFGPFARRRCTCCAGTNGCRGAELGAIDLGVELSCVHKACLAQLVERKALNLVVMGSSPTVGVLIFLSLLLIYFCCPDFSFMSLIYPSRFISHPYFFCFYDWFVYSSIYFFVYPASTAVVCHSGREPSLPPLFAQLTYT